MKRSTERILTTHAGSLPRPAILGRLHAQRSRGEAVDSATLDGSIEQAVSETLARQVEVGLDVINNGEVGRESFFTYLRHRMTGFGGQSERRAMADLIRHPEYAEMLVRTRGGRERVDLLRAPQAVSEVTYVGRDAIDAECEQLRRLLEPHAGQYTEAFVSSPSPGIVAAAMQNAFYPDLPAYVRALGRALAVEYRAIVDAGFLLQVDAPDLALERHTLFQDKPLGDFLDFVRVVVSELNAALEAVPAERVRLHVCWGNYEGAHDADVPLEDIWPEVEKANVGGVLLSMANPRHAHEYRLFESQRLPDGVLLVPGVIDTTTNYVEHPEVVADRVERVARAVGDPTRVIAGTDCGLETSAGGSMLVTDIAWEKLRSLVSGAALASARLFGAP